MFNIPDKEITEYKKKVGHNLAKFRNEKNMSQADLAELTGLNPSSLGCIEIGKTQPKIDTLLKISKALDIEPQDIYKIKSEQVLEDELRKLKAENAKLNEQLKSKTEKLDNIMKHKGSLIELYNILDK